MSRQERERRQQQDEAAWREQQQERQDEPQPTITLSQQCPARLGGAHNFTMKGRDGIRRCWYCAAERPGDVNA
jgi:hypothetical protein